MHVYQRAMRRRADQTQTVGFARASFQIRRVYFRVEVVVVVAVAHAQLKAGCLIIFCAVVVACVFAVEYNRLIVDDRIKRLDQVIGE